MSVASEIPVIPVPAEATGPVIKRAKLTQENVSVSSISSTTPGSSNGSPILNGVLRPAAGTTLKQRQDARNGEHTSVSAKAVRATAPQPVPAVSSGSGVREPERKRNGGLGEEDSPYERAVAAITQSEKRAGEGPTHPVADTPARAAFLSRLDPLNLNPREEKDFPEVARGTQALKDLHLELRNRVLQLWLRNPRQHLVVCNVLESLADAELVFDQEHLVKIVKCLNRMCLVNFGDFPINRALPPTRTHVIVIGAGLAGLAAARQLKHFGFKVTVVEARNRVGGRVSTWTATGQKSMVAECGAMLITGIEGNPVHTILHGQMAVKTENVVTQCPIFRSNGQLVPEEIDNAIEQELSQLEGAAPAHYRSFYSSANDEKSQSSSTGQPSASQSCGLGVCMKELLELKELEVTLANNVKLKERVNETWRLADLYNSRHELFHKTKSLVAEYKKLFQLGQKNAASRCRNRLAELRTQLRTVELDIQMAEALPDPSVPHLEYATYVAPEDRSLVAWHMANYDFANALPLEEMSIEHWDEEVVLTGGHYSVPGGLFQLTDRLSAGLCVSYNQRLVKIVCDNTGVNVTVKFAHNDATREIQADAVISTLPLGILKQALVDDHIKFEPPLPPEKVLSINRLGYGVFNKVILTYSRKFWRAKRAIFGYANGNLDRRGEFFMFWSLYDQPVLVALISGRAATELEAVSDSDIVQSCTEVLQKIFGRSMVMSPKETVVTRWGADEFSRGSFSSVPVGASGQDFDVLAEPISVDGVPRLCFAGEHTARHYAGTMHGALLSGFREATRLADSLGGADNIY